VAGLDEDATAAGLDEDATAADLDEDATAAGLVEDATGAGLVKERVGGIGGRMRMGTNDPCWVRPRCAARGAFSGRGQPCPTAKLDFSFSTGQG
jgi:hypothetical protein